MFFFDLILNRWQNISLPTRKCPLPVEVRRTKFPVITIIIPDTISIITRCVTVKHFWSTQNVSYWYHCSLGSNWIEGCFTNSQRSI